MKRKLQKCLAISEIIANFAALKSVLEHRSIANFLKEKALGGVSGVCAGFASVPSSSNKNENKEPKDIKK